MYDSAIHKISVDSDGKITRKEIDPKDFYIEVNDMKGDAQWSSQIMEENIRLNGQLTHYKKKCSEAQAEIDVTYGKAFVAGKKNGEETMQAEIDHLKAVVSGQARKIEQLTRAEHIRTKKARLD